MPKTRNIASPQNLDKYKVYIEDSGMVSSYFRVTNLPQMFTGGRNSFLIGGSPFLKVGTQVLIEIVDANNRPVYYRPIPNYIQGNSRLISVEITDQIAAGFATLTLIGVADKSADGNRIPDSWQNKYNVRWTTKIPVEPNLKNTSKLILERPPTAFSVENRLYNVATSSYTTSSIPFTASLSSTFKSAVTNGYVINAEAPTSFSAELLGGYITGSFIIDGESASLYLPLTNILNTSTSFSTGYVIKTTSDKVIDKIYLKSGSYQTLVGGQLSTITSSAKITYGTLDTTNVNIPISYANLRIINLNTVSGEISKVRVSSKVSTNLSDYKMVADVPVITTEIFVSQSNRGNLPIGDFYQSPSTASWYADKLLTSSNVVYPISGSPAYYNATVTSEPVTLSLDNNVLISSLYSKIPINGSSYSGSFSGSGYFIGTKNPVVLFPSTEYTLSVDAYYRKTSGSYTLSSDNSYVDIYIVGVSGSNIISNNPLGQKLGRLEVQSGAFVKWFQQQLFNFNPLLPENGGTVGLRFVIANGFWNFSNISLKPASDTTFSPDEIQILVPNTEYYNSYLQHKIEFFDINSNSTDVVAISTPTFFTGSNIDLGTLP